MFPSPANLEFDFSKTPELKVCRLHENHIMKLRMETEMKMEACFIKRRGVVGFETKHCETPRAFPLMGRGNTHRSVAAVCLKERERIFLEFERY